MSIPNFQWSQRAGFNFWLLFENDTVQSRFGCIWHAENKATVDTLEQQFLKEIQEK